MKLRNLTNAICIISIALYLSSCSAHGENKFKASGIVLPSEVSEDKDSFVIVDEKDFRKIICADLTKDGSEEMIVTQLYYKKGVPRAETPEDFYHGDLDSCAYIYIYDQHKELLYSERIWPFSLDSVEVQNGRIYGTIPILTACIAFKEGRFCSFDDQYKKLVGDELIQASVYGEDVDPAACARQVIMSYYGVKEDNASNEIFPVEDIELMGSEAIVAIEHNGNMHAIRLEARGDLPPEGPWTAVIMNITAGEKQRNIFWMRI